MTPRPAWQPPVTEGQTPHDRFINLLDRLLRVPKHDVDEQRQSDEAQVEKKREPS